ncbi:rCG28705 [Rattus norvegicus]|uniref:RCG28705 n=1 Tax=Rattus norvegicus TaxID=10116 RepID=A6HWC9_RAT|nr:rCG28705 [Rattus norvegicus]
MAPKAQKSPKGQRKGKKKTKQQSLVSEEEEPMNMESMGHPEIYPLVLTAKTQEIFNCRIDEDMTDEQTYKLIKKEDILADLQNRAAVSDFHPVKKIVLEYPGEELLLVYDKDFKYGLNFYLIGTEEGKENFLKLMLESPDDIFCFEFCPSDPNIIAGGCINGQIILWDITAHAERIENIKTGGSRSKKATLKPMFLLEPDSNKEIMYVRHCAVSSIENGHRKVITDIHWLPDSFEINRMGSVFENRSGINCQLITCSADCTICFWDIRPQKPTVTSAATATTTSTTNTNPQQPPAEKKKEESIEIPFDVPSTFLHLDLSWKPLSRIKLSKGETSLDHCPTKLSLGEDPALCKIQGTSSIHVLLRDKMLSQMKLLKAAEINPYQNLEGGMANMLKPIEDFRTKFFVGTEEGEVIYTDWKMERDSETGRLMAKKPVNLYTVHDGAVHTVQRSPFFNDIILTVGGWNVAIWKEEVLTGPLLQTCCAPKRYTAGHWSLTRPGVFYIGREDGYVDIWDLLEKTHEPAQSQSICITMITYIKPWTFSCIKCELLL